MRIFSKKTAYQSGLLALITVGVFFLIFKSFDIDLSQITEMNKKFLLLAILINLPIPVLSAWRWSLALKGMGTPAPFGQILRIILSTWILAILPGRIGDFGRALALKNVPLNKGFGSILFEKIIDIFTLVLISIIGLFWLDRSAYAIIMAALLTAGIIGLYSLPRIIRFFPRFVRSKLIESYDVSLGLMRIEHVLKIGGVSAINWLMIMFQVYLLFKAANSNVTLSAVIGFFPLTIFIGLLPITLAGMGTRDSAIIGLFADFATPSQSLAVGIWYSILGFWFFAILGLPLIYPLLRELRKINFSPQN